MNIMYFITDFSPILLLPFPWTCSFSSILLTSINLFFLSHSLTNIYMTFFLSYSLANITMNLHFPSHSLANTSWTSFFPIRLHTRHELLSLPFSCKHAMNLFLSHSLANIVMNLFCSLSFSYKHFYELILSLPFYCDHLHEAFSLPFTCIYFYEQLSHSFSCNHLYSISPLL